MKTSDSRSGGFLLGLLITLAGLVCLAAVMGLYLARNVRVETDSVRAGDHVSIETPAGNFSIQAHASGKALVDVPSYPGARRGEHSWVGAEFKWTPNRDGRDAGLTVVGEEMITSDSVDDVVKFYKAQLPAWVLVTNRDGSASLEREKNGSKRFVAIKRKPDGTHIGVASIGEAASN